MIKVVAPLLQQQHLRTSNEKFSVSQTPSLFHLKSSKRKKGISGNRIIDINVLS